MINTLATQSELLEYVLQQFVKTGHKLEWYEMVSNRCGCRGVKSKTTGFVWWAVLRVRGNEARTSLEGSMQCPHDNGEIDI